MRPIVLTALCLSVNLFSFAQDGVFKNAEVITGNLVRVTKPLKDLTEKDLDYPYVQVRNENGRIWPEGIKPAPFDPPKYTEQQQKIDPVLQTGNQGNLVALNGAVTSNWNGMGYTMVNPPDPTLCVGPNHVIQMINGSSGAYFKVYNKSGGDVVVQTYLDNITLKGGLGDPIALYDHLADRYVLTEFVDRGQVGSEGLVFAVSKTNDPAGQWYVYFFSTGTVFPDYPKFSVWPDAYYGTTNNFTSSYVGSSVYAFDRAKMLAGNATATMQKITVGNTNKYFSMCPVALEGNTLPPAGSGGLIAYMQDNVWTSSTTDVDSIGLLEFNVNFTTPSLSTVTTKSSLAASPFIAYICSATRGQCISQPGSSVKVEALDERIMNQPVYRRFAGYEGIVLTHSANIGSDISGVRWYELRKTSGDWGIYQQATYSPDNSHRWMPGICYDSYGNIGLAYNVSSSATGVYPGVRYTGRKECDPLNTMTYAEETLVSGAAANGSNRYGDYSHLVCDPDGVRFWFTAEWNNASTWSTRISSFTLDACGEPPPFVCNPPATMSASLVTTTSAVLNWGAVNGAVSYDVDYGISGSDIWTSAAIGTSSTLVSITGLIPNTSYDWRVRTNCDGSQSGYLKSLFVTMSLTCPDQYEPNNTLVTAAAIPVSTEITAKIAASGDNDYYAFSNSITQKMIKITLSNLPADLDMKLYQPSGSVVKTAAHRGLVNEEIIYNAKKVGTYKIYVYGYNAAFNANQCYTIQVMLNAVNFGPGEPDDEAKVEIVRSGLNIYPIPAKEAVTVGFDAYAKGTADIFLTNGMGQTVIHKTVTVSDGMNFNTIDIKSLQPGIYFIKVENGKDVKFGRVVKN